jgi:hypothetical protein
LYFSCDSGYSDIELSKTCFDNKLTYISVPKKSHLLEITDKTDSSTKTNLEDWIKKVFLVKKQEHELAQAQLAKKERKPFCYRFRACIVLKKDK